jgi:hypothetical protein
MQEAFIEMDRYEGTARQQRDQRAAQLKALGYECRCLTLHRVQDGVPVYIVESHLPEPIDPSSDRSSSSLQRLRDNASPRRIPKFEVR